MLLRALSSWLLKSLEDGGSATSLGNLFQCSIVLMVNKFFTISSLVQALLFQFMPVIFCSSATDRLKPSLLQPIEAPPLLVGHVRQPLGHPEPPLNLFQLMNISCIRGPQIECISDVV